MPDVMTPMTWSMMQSLLGVVGSIFRLVGADVTRAPLAGLVAGRLYFNANTILAAVKPFSFLHKGLPILPGRWEAIWWRHTARPR